MRQKIGILGAGGQADELESYIDKHTEVIFRAVTPEFLNTSDPVSINIDSPDKLSTVPVVSAVGAPGLRRKLIERWGGNRYVSIISKEAYFDKTSKIGVGCILSPKSVITTNSIIGDHVIVNVGVTISHNVEIQDFVTLSPGVNIAGNVLISEGVFIGIGASVSNGVKIAPGCVIGAGCVVTKNIETENSVVVGVPGRTIKNNEGWLNAL